VQLVSRGRVRRPLVQISVVVANIQMRTLKTGVEKGTNVSNEKKRKPKETHGLATKVKNASYLAKVIINL
jgi:hypothetical protein